VVAVTALDGAGRPLAQGRCATEVPAAQDEAVAQAQPDVVVWWSRYELADRIGPDGARLVAGTPAFWAAQRADLRAAADRLT
ncbi:hypothetical protein, partial [Salmonella enterica]|uniref:hypothetical protein n=1 Tax=Salmonella enterica TaxID=28901 RepID=UPI0032B3432F